MVDSPPYMVAPLQEVVVCPAEASRLHPWVLVSVHVNVYVYLYGIQINLCSSVIDEWWQETETRPVYSPTPVCMHVQYAGVNNSLGIGL